MRLSFHLELALFSEHLGLQPTWVGRWNPDTQSAQVTMGCNPIGVSWIRCHRPDQCYCSEHSLKLMRRHPGSPTTQALAFPQLFRAEPLYSIGGESHERMIFGATCTVPLRLSALRRQHYSLQRPRASRNVGKLTLRAPLPESARRDWCCLISVPKCYVPGRCPWPDGLG